MHSIGKVKLEHLVVHVDGYAEDADVDLGGVFFCKEGRTYALDTVSVRRDASAITATLERDDEVFGDTEYDLTDEDILQGCNITAYVEGGIEVAVLGVELVARLGNMTMIIPVKRED